MILKFRAEVWKWEANGNGSAAWHFITLDKKSAAVVKKGQEGKKRIGWGSVPVVVTIGQTSWKTSIFPVSKRGSYLLPLKAAVRRKEGLAEGDSITISLQI
jgi:Domain of unknown function (DUF1905)